MLELFKRFAENVYVNLVSGMVLLTTSGVEILESLEEGVGAHHGVAIFAVVNVLRIFPEIVHGSEQVTKLNRHANKASLATDEGVADGVPHDS
jgi:hypothetical protein